jgi:endo-1,3(4)-beta-glucanase
VVKDNMIPICPISSYIKTKTFAVNDWNRYFGEDFIVADKTWTSLIREGQALVNAEKSYLFFSSSSFEFEYMMDGESRAYYSIYAAILAYV